MTFMLGEYQDIFLEEADEQLQELNINLMELEKDPENTEIINNIFRTAHSLKSSAAFVGLNDLSDLAHKMENLLQGLRDNTLTMSSEIVDIIFKCFDEISAVIDSIVQGEKPEQDLTWLINEIHLISEKGKVEKAQPVPKPDKMNTQKFTIKSEQSRMIREGIKLNKGCFELSVHISESAQMKWIKAQLILTNLEKIGDIVITDPPSDNLNDETLDGIFKIILLSEVSVEEIKKACDIDLITRVDLRSISLVKKDGKLMLKFGKEMNILEVMEDAESEPEPQEKTVDPTEKGIGFSEDEEFELGSEEIKDFSKVEYERRKAPIIRSVKVSVDKLDQLLNNVGELVISNSGFFKLYDELRRAGIDKSFSNEFKSRMDQMSKIAKDLQTGIMNTRMVEIGNVFTRFKRLVRDLTKESNKDIKLIIKGEDTELDKKVIDAIGEPLLHIIRNAIDHGIEATEEREKLGKSLDASITLNAYQGGNQIFVEVSDDGRGMDINEIKRKIVSKGLSTQDILANMDDIEIINHIFLPGFSTAKVISDISGRGVGLNVVKESVTELNGTVSIETEPGMGTRFILTFPLTLAIIPAIMVRVQREMFAIPLSDVIETIKVSQSEITTIEGHEVINLRGEILSIIRLNNFIGLESALNADQKIPVVIVGFGSRKVGLMVDFLEGKQEIVIKSLDQNYKTVDGLAGASILGDGSIALIMDIAVMINKVIADEDKISKIARERKIQLKQAELLEKAEVEAVIEKGEELIDDEIDKIKEEKERDEEITIAVETPEEKISVEIPAREEEEKKPEKTEPVDETDKEIGEPETDEDVDDEIKLQVQDTLETFKEELRNSISSTVEGAGADNYMSDTLKLAKEDLNQFQVIANVGAANAAESLSKIIKKRIDLSIPEVIYLPVEKIPEHIGSVDSVYIGVMMNIQGDLNGTILFILHDQVGFDLIDLLYGTESSNIKKLDEDGESALVELTNIVGASVINVFSDKTELVIMTSVPTIVHDYMQSIIDSILVKHSMLSDYAIIMDTAFFLEDNRVIGNLLLLAEEDSLKNVIQRLTSNVGTN
ncbi:chemotaxis protein CheW [Spirochaetota bacterium]